RGCSDRSRIRLSLHAQPHAGRRLASGRGNGLATSLSMAQAFTRRQFAAGPLDGVLYGVGDLVLYRTVLRPSACHVCLRTSLVIELAIIIIRQAIGIE